MGMGYKLLLSTVFVEITFKKMHQKSFNKSF